MADSVEGRGAGVKVRRDDLIAGASDTGVSLKGTCCGDFGTTTSREGSETGGGRAITVIKKSSGYGAGEARQRVGVIMDTAGLVLDGEFVFGEAENPTHETRGGATFHGIAHGVKPPERSMIDHETELATPKVRPPVLDGLDGSEKLELGDGVMNFMFV